MGAVGGRSGRAGRAEPSGAATDPLGEDPHRLLRGVLDAPEAGGGGLARPPVEPGRLHGKDVAQQIAGGIVAQEKSHLMQPLPNGDDGLDARLDRGRALRCLHAETS